LGILSWERARDRRNLTAVENKRAEAMRLFREADQASMRDYVSPQMPVKFESGPSPSGMFTDPLKLQFGPQNLEMKIRSGALLTPEETKQAFDMGYNLRYGSEGARVVGSPEEANPTMVGGVDIGSPAGEAPMPGALGKVPGFRTPAEIAATLATGGIGPMGPLAKVGMLVGGSAGAFLGGKGAMEVGLPPAVGELAGGLAGGIGGTAVAERVGPVVGRMTRESVSRTRVQPGMGGGPLGSDALRVAANAVQDQIGFADKMRLQKLGIDPQAIDDPATIARIRAEAPDIAQKLEPFFQQVEGGPGGTGTFPGPETEDWIPKRPTDIGDIPEAPEAGGFPDRFAGKARAIQGGPPPPEPPPAGVGGDEPLNRLINLVRSAKKPLHEQEILRHEELGKRIGRAGEVIRGEGTATQRLRAAKGQLAGEQPVAQFEAVRPAFTDDEYNQLLDRALWHEFPHPSVELGQISFENMRAGDAFESLMLGKLPTRSDIGLLEQVYGPDLAKAILGKRPLGSKAWENTLDAAALLKTALTVLDHSFPGRQGIKLAPSHPKAWTKSAVQGAKALFNPKFAAAVDTELLTDATPILVRVAPNKVKYMPYADFKKLAGIYHASLAESTPIGAREEAFMSRWARSIPGLGKAIAASERGFVTSGNKLRSDILKNWALGVNSTGEAIDLSTGKGFANLLNRATGRGTLGALEEAAPVLNAFQFAPRYRASHPEWIANLFNYQNPAVAREAWKQVVSFYATGITILAAMKYSGMASVEVDPRSSDFGKIRVGKTRIDFWGGTQPIIRAVAMAATQSRKSSTGRIFPIKPHDVVWNYLRMGMSPAASVLTDIYAGTTVVGGELKATPKGVGTQLFDRLIPLAWQDIIQAVKEDGLRGGLMASTSLGGFGVSSFESPSVERLRKFKEKTGYDFNVESAYDRKLMETDPTLAPLTQEVKKIGEAAGFEGAKISAAKRTAVEKAEQDQGIVRLAEEIQAGGNARNWSKVRSDFLSFRAGVQSVWPLDIDPNTPAGKLADEYFSLNPKAPEFTDAEGETDWNRYETAREAVLARMDPQDAQTIREADKFTNPAAVAIDREFRQARDLLKQLDSTTSKWNGLTPEQSKQLDEFSAEVSRQAPILAARAGRHLSELEVADYLAKQQGESGLAQWFEATQSTKFREANRNPEYDQFLATNRAVISKFFPRMYSQAELERIGAITPAEDQGFGPMQPLSSFEPMAPMSGR